MKQSKFPTVINTGYELIRVRNQSDVDYAWSEIKRYYAEMIKAIFPDDKEKN